MTPAIARATDFRFRVMFIVFSPLWGRRVDKSLAMGMQDKTSMAEIGYNLGFS